MSDVRPPRSEAESTAFLAALRANDPAAVLTLVRSETPRLLSVARRILRNEEDACDAVQDGFISALSALSRFEGGAQLSTWLHRIIVNAALMKLRSKRARPEESIDDLLPTFDEEGHVAWSQPVECGQLAVVRQLRLGCVRDDHDRHRHARQPRLRPERPDREVEHLIAAAHAVERVRDDGGGCVTQHGHSVPVDRAAVRHPDPTATKQPSM